MLLNRYEVETALRFFMYHLEPELRGKLMTEFPVIYNKLVEKEIMVSKKRSEINGLKEKRGV